VRTWSIQGKANRTCEDRPRSRAKSGIPKEAFRNSTATRSGKTRSAFFKAHKQASENTWSSLIRFIALCTAEPADESGWMRIAEAFENK
jgi:hypothetical protein